MKPEIIYAIILAATVLTAIIIGCYFVNRKELSDKRKETTRNARSLNQ